MKRRDAKRERIAELESRIGALEITLCSLIDDKHITYAVRVQNARAVLDHNQ